MLVVYRTTVVFKVGSLKVFHSGYQENERAKDLIVDQKFHRTIIGQKGEKIKEVRDKFPEVFLYSFTLLVSLLCVLNVDGIPHLQVIINFPDPAQKSDIVQLRGPKNEVEKCAKFLQKIIAELVCFCYFVYFFFFFNLFFMLNCLLLQIENSFSLSVPIFKQFHKNIIGKGGTNIKKARFLSACVSFCSFTVMA